MGQLFLRWGLVLAIAGTARAERLPIRSFTSIDGLAGDQVRCVVEDSRGFLWIGTSTGLSRFDGLRFVNYGTEHGLPHPGVNDVLETRRGEYWIATDAGLARLEPGAADTAAKFSVFPLESAVVYDLHQDRRSRLWFATNRGLFRWSEEEGEAGLHDLHPVQLPAGPDGPKRPYTLADDAEGSLWVGTDWGVVRILPDGRTVEYPVRPFDNDDRVHDLAFDGGGRLWIAHWGVYVLLPRPAAEIPEIPRRSLADSLGEDGRSPWLPPARPGDLTYLHVGNALSSNRVFDLAVSVDGRVRMATNAGLTLFDGTTLRVFDQQQGLVHDTLNTAQDRAGNVWIGTDSSGLLRWNPRGLTTFTTEDGLISDLVSNVLQDRSNQLIVTTTSPQTGEEGRVLGHSGLHRRGAESFAGVLPGGTETIDYWGWGWNQTVLQAKTGEWWIATGNGLLRYAARADVLELGATEPLAIYTSRDGLGGDDVFRIFEDSRGDLWIGNFGFPTLARWSRSDGSLKTFSTTVAPSAFAEDRHGAVWVGFYLGGVARHGREGEETFDAADGAPLGFISDLLVDGAGRLWIASQRDGLTRIDEPAAERPRFHRLTTTDGLASNGITALTDDRWGRIYAASGRGVDCLWPDGRISQRWTAADGLASHHVRTAFRDRQDRLWFGTAKGLSRLVPEAEVPVGAPPVLISGFSVAGVPYPVSELGAQTIEGLVLGPGQNRIRIDFLGLNLASSEQLSYQYKLADADQDWGPLNRDRSVIYANLAPGRYRFSVRALTANGTPSPEPAEVSFTIEPPLWQRGWFLALVAAALAAVLPAYHRYRLRRALELERMRTRIATDLHDDLGAGLARISVLSEVAKQQAEGGDRGAAHVLEQIGRSARELIDAASDIVWAVDPRHDDLASLTVRLRRFASDLFEGEGLDWKLETRGDLARVDVTVDQRRHLWLIMKEALHNVVRHAEATRVEISIAVRGIFLTVEVRDDGRGFDVTRTDDAGNGLRNMRSRAEEVRGRLRLDSEPGRGSRLTVEMPVG